ncbi:hypothetical protein MVES1_000799 [Malassezia vespertilionis]|uniref:TauD/TfdA-like domain-containing protein n=1 Tax=Malassezia vespertilionis TaxID=2020962 RepID=A0A2N1JEQ8_9BASI|nr:uncharacterized protein MVES1_000799 [Malassezia vespertilionis]PKI85038.1 hypothetical protein MVES_000749 [Malassezia vespertilionis]WFD05469.1 hypothetical protein MVES1_000799 [Malassezia vespertilionis]
MATALQVQSAPPFATPLGPKSNLAHGRVSKLASSKPEHQEPLKLSGILDELYESEESTPAIGRTYPTLQLRDLIYHEKADELIRELAIIISRRGVVFFKNQDISPEEQKFVTDRLGRLSGKPSSSNLHVHPVYNASRNTKDQVVDGNGTRNTDNEISVISSNINRDLEFTYKSGADEWHTDIAFENVPSDYTSLKVHTQPKTGGDTLWASGYEIYDLMSPTFRKIVENLNGYFFPREFIESTKRHGFDLHAGPRGSPANVGTHLSAVHPLVRTNPITGWKSVYAVGHHFENVEGLSAVESDMIKDYLQNLLIRNHHTQVRHRWSKNDLAIWDNRSTFHAATPDYYALGPRSGVRAVSCGEKPYFDRNSHSRKEQLGEDQLI